MINIDNLAGWVGQQWDNTTNAVATGISTATSWVEGAIESGMGWASTAVTSAVDAVTTAASGAVEAVTNGVSGMVDGAADWVAELVPDGLLTSLGVGGGGLLAALLGFRLLWGAMGRQRGAAEYALYKVPAALCEKVRSILQAAGITTVDGEALEGWATFSVARYHIGPAERVLRGLQVQWERVA